MRAWPFVMRWQDGTETRFADHRAHEAAIAACEKRGEHEEITLQMGWLTAYRACSRCLTVEVVPS